MARPLLPVAATGLAVALALPLLGATAATAAPAPGEVLHVLGYDDKSISTVDTATAALTAIGTIPDIGLVGGDYNPITRLASYVAWNDQSGYSITSMVPATGVIVSSIPLVEIDPADVDDTYLRDLDISADGTARMLITHEEDEDGVDGIFLATVDLVSGHVTRQGPIELAEDQSVPRGLASNSAGVMHVVGEHGEIAVLSETVAGYSSTVLSAAIDYNRNWVADFDSNDVLWFDEYDPETLWSFDSTDVAAVPVSVGASAVEIGALYFVTPPRPLAATLSAATVVAGGTVTVTGENFTPGGDVRIELHSDPVVLATTEADAEGDVSATLTIPTGTVAAPHSVHLFDLDGGTSVAVPLTVTAVVVPEPEVPVVPEPEVPAPVVPSVPAQGAGAGVLAATGANAGGIALGSAAFLLVGLGLFTAARRRGARAQG